MSTSGKVSSNGYEGRYITFSWNLTSQSVKNNTSTISWKLEGDGTAETSRYKAGNFKVVIDGVTVYSTSENDRIWLYDGTVVASGNYTFTHNNAGAKSFSVQIQAGIYYYAVNCTGSGSFTLPTISRISSITAVNGANTSDLLDVMYTEYVSSYTNNLLISLNNTTIQTISNYTSGANFELSGSALNAIYTGVTTSKTATLGFKLQTYDGSTLLGTSDTVTKSLTINDSNPTIGGVTYADTNSTTKAITGSDQYLIQEKSTLAVIVTNLAAKNGATLSTLRVTGAGINKAVSLSGDTDATEVVNIGTVNQSSDFNLTITLTDSRGNTATKAIDVYNYEYVSPTAVVTVARQDNYYSDTDITATSSYSSIGGHNQVTLTARYYRSGQPSQYTDITLQDGVTSTVSLDNTAEWVVRVTVADRLESTNYTFNVGLGLPILFVDTINRAVGVNCFPTQEGSLEVNGLRLDDKIYIGSQQLYDHIELTTAGSSVVATAYDYRLIQNIFAGIAIPDNYERAYKITFQAQTQNENTVTVSLNNISSNAVNTWSNTTFRTIGGTRIFKESELTLETTSGYSRDGLNLSVSNSGAYTANVWAITIHGYLVNKDTDLDVSTYDLPDDTPTPA